MSSVVGFIKGKGAIHPARVYGDEKQNYAGQSFWHADISYQPSVAPRAYIRNQEHGDKPWDQLKMWR